MTDPGGQQAVPSIAHVAVEDQDLLARIRAQDESALATLYDRYSGLVYTLALRILGDRDLAEEILQDTFLRCWDNAELFDPQRGRVAGWLMGVARNRAIDVLRGRQHQARLRERGTLADDPAPPEPSQSDESEAVALRYTIRGALAALSTGQRQALELAYYGGLTQSEIAQSLGEPLGTIKTRIRDGIGRLRDLLYPTLDVGEAP